MKILVTGYEGRLGSEFVRRGAIPLECDITSELSVKESLGKVSGDVLVNCAAYTDVDACENPDTFEDLALQVNYWGVENLRQNFKGRIIHISTDYVFSGKNGPYREYDDYDPVNAYGYSKMGGEIVFLTPHRKGDFLIRTTGLYGRGNHHDFVKLVLNTLSKGHDLNVIQTLRGNQTYIPHLVDGILHVINRPERFSKPVVHIASRDIITRYEFALMIASIFGLDKRLLHPVNTIDGWVAKRPVKGGLRVTRRKGIPLRDITDGLFELKNELT